MFSLVESKLILPAHLAHMKIRHYEKDTHNVFVRFQRFFSEGLHHFVAKRYVPALIMGLKRRYLTLSIFMSLLILSIGLLLGGILRFVFFPDITADFLQVELQMNEGTPATQTHEALRRVQDGLWEVDRKVSAEQGVESGAVVSGALSFARNDTSGRIARGSRRNPGRQGSGFRRGDRAGRRAVGLTAAHRDQHRAGRAGGK
jgi:multidrug efflux pump subunit AcrB